MRRISQTDRLRLWCSVSLIAIPAVIFYFVLWQTSVDIPIFDDYANVLGFANGFVQTHGFFNRLWMVLTYQHNEYKLIFENAVVATQYLIFGHIYFQFLVALGDAFAVLIFVTICSMFRYHQDDWTKRVMLLVPVAYLIFQLQYASALNWASSSLQHLAVIFFSLLSIHLLSRSSGWLFAGACGALVLAIASSANGFFVVPIGILMICQNKQWRRIPIWIAVAVGMLILYLWKYNFYSSQANPHRSVTDTMSHVSIRYALSFLGSSVARYEATVPSIIFGTALVGIFVAAIRRAYFRRNASVFYSMLFIIITAIGVSGLRSDFGLAQSLASRYRTYSNLMIVLSYFFMVENVLDKTKKQSVRQAALCTVLAGAMMFCVVSTYAGARFLNVKKQLLISSMKEWQNSSLQVQAQDNQPTADSELNSTMIRQIDAGVYKPQGDVLRESECLGLYMPRPE